MRRTAVVALAVCAALGASACSPAKIIAGDQTSPAGATAAPTVALPSSRLFDQAFPWAADGGEATITVSPPRMVTSYTHKDHVVVVDLRAVQASGAPVVDPATVHAYDPGGEEFPRIEYPKGTVDDPLIRTTLQSPGQEVRGTIAWTMPYGSRIGRVDVVSGTEIDSLTVTVQPVDPEDTTSSTPATSTGG